MPAEWTTEHCFTLRCSILETLNVNTYELVFGCHLMMREVCCCLTLWLQTFLLFHWWETILDTQFFSSQVGSVAA